MNTVACLWVSATVLTSFQEKMNELFVGFEDVRAYLDDCLLITSGTYEHHLELARSFFSGMVLSLTQVERTYNPVEPCMKMTAQKDGVCNEHCVLRYTYLHVEIIGYKEREMCISPPRILTII